MLGRKIISRDINKPNGFAFLGCRLCCHKLIIPTFIDFLSSRSFTKYATSLVCTFSLDVYTGKVYDFPHFPIEHALVPFHCDMFFFSFCFFSAHTNTIARVDERNDAKRFALVLLLCAFLFLFSLSSSTTESRRNIDRDRKNSSSITRERERMNLNAKAAEKFPTNPARLVFLFHYRMQFFFF